MTAQLGRALTVLLRHHRMVQSIDEDLMAYWAPSECWAIAHRGDQAAERQAMRHACHIAGVTNRRALRRAFRRVLGNDAWVYKRYGFVPY